MSTESLVARLRPYAKDWNITGNRSILSLIQNRQDELFACNDLMMRFIPSDNKGFPPYLKTVAATYQYSINSTNLSSALNVSIGGTSYEVKANKILGVFIDSGVSSYRDDVMGRTYIYRYGNPGGSDSSRIEVANVPVRTRHALETTAPLVTFFNDPGTYNDRYFVELTHLPPRLTAVSIPLMVPIEFEQAIFEGVLGEIRFVENGTYNDMQTRFEKYWKPRFHSDQSSGTQFQSNEVTPIDC